MELFNDINGDSGGYLHQLVISISLQRRLATVGFTGTNGIQSHPPTHRIIANRLLMIFMTYTMHLIMVHVYISEDMVRVRLDRGSCSAQFSFSLPISERLSHISILVVPSSNYSSITISTFNPLQGYAWIAIGRHTTTSNQGQYPHNQCSCP